ncbi:hypothetical protein J4W43_24985, partial [Escherichia coli]
MAMSAPGTERTVRLDSDLYSLADTNQPHIPAFQIISDRYYRCESPATFPVRGVLSFFTGNTCMNPSDAIEAIEKPLSSLPYSLS